MADPIHKNIRWAQLLFGAFLAFVAYRSYLAWSGAQPLTQGEGILLFLTVPIALLMFVLYLRNMYRHGLVPDYSLKCRYCEGPVNRYSEFCEHCGADLIAEEKLAPCRKCGVDLVEGTPYCPECGARQPPTRGAGGSGPTVK